MRRWETGGPQPRMLRMTFEGRDYQANDIKSIFALVRNHKLSRNERWLPGTEDLIWEALRESHPKHIHEIQAPGKPGVSLSAAFSFIHFMIKRGASKETVPPEEAERRAAICRACPMSSEVPACLVCKQGLKLLVTPPYRLEVPEGCLACGCYLPLKAWVPRQHLGSAEDFPYHAECWMRDGSPPVPEPHPDPPSE